MSKIPNNFMPYRAKNVRRWNPDAGVLLHSDVGGLFVDINDYNKLEQCIARLEAENERLSAPVTPEEFVFHGGVNFSDAHKKSLSRIITARKEGSRT